MATEKTTKKKKNKPLPIWLAALLLMLAVAVMASFLYYVLKPPKNGDSSGSYVGSQDFGDESDKEYKVELGGVQSDLQKAELLDIFSFGKYEQDGNAENGAEAIEWIVIEKTEDSVLLISRNALEGKQFNEARTDCSFAGSTLKAFLNGEFFSSAFDDEEKSIVSEIEGNKVAIPSKDEIVKGLSVDETHVDSAKATVFAESKGVRTRNSACMWWLRDKGLNDSSAMYVYYDGTIRENGYAVDYNEVAVRPVIKLTIK